MLDPRRVVTSTTRLARRRREHAPMDDAGGWLDWVGERARALRVILPPAAALLALGPVAGGAQSVEGRLRDAQTGVPIPHAVIRLVDVEGEGRAASAADSLGRYRVVAPEPGVYRIRAEQLGYQALETAPFELVDSMATRTLDMTLSASPIPVRGVDVTTDAVNRRIRQTLGISPELLRVRPLRSPTIRDHVRRGNGLSEMMSLQQIPNFRVLRSRQGPCYQFRASGCLPVFLDGARLNRASVPMLPLEMVSTVVILLPNEVIAYPSGAVHLFSVGFMG